MISAICCPWSAQVFCSHGRGDEDQDRFWFNRLLDLIPKAKDDLSITLGKSNCQDVSSKASLQFKISMHLTWKINENKKVMNTDSQLTAQECKEVLHQAQSGFYA
jgi:hypothetical protein